MTTEELRQQEEEAKKKLEEHKQWKKEFNWFAIIPRDPFWDGESGTLVIELDEMKEFLENIRSNDEKTKWSGKVEFVYKTNGWKENLKELD
jgi:hypothetical protein